MLVARFMTPDPITVEPSAGLEDAMRLMDELGIRHLPVVEEGRLVGVLSDRDLLARTGWRVLGPRRTLDDGPRCVADVMHTEIVTVGSDEPAVAAAVEVVERGIGCLPVVDHGKLVGIVSEMDLLRLYAEIHEQAGCEYEDPTVEQAAHRNAVDVSLQATIEQVDELMHAKGYRHLPVVVDGALLGMLSDRDLRRAAGAHLSPSATIEAIMTREVHTIPWGTRLSFAAARMVEEHVSALPVVGEDSIGILTSVDVLRCGMRELG